MDKVSIPTRLDPKQIVLFEELLMSQVIQQEALTKLLIEKGMFTRDDFLEMVRVVDQKRSGDVASRLKVG